MVSNHWLMAAVFEKSTFFNMHALGFFIFFFQCKDLIRIVKNWSNAVPWRNASSKPSHYLLSLLVTAAYQVVNE